MVRSTLAPVPSAGRGRGCGQGWRRLAGISGAVDGFGKLLQAERAKAHSSSGGSFDGDDTLDLAGDSAALGRDAGLLGLVAGGLAVSAPTLQALRLDIRVAALQLGLSVPASLKLPGQAKAAQQADGKRPQGQVERECPALPHRAQGTAQAHAGTASRTAWAYSAGQVLRWGFPGRHVRM